MYTNQIFGSSQTSKQEPTLSNRQDSSERMQVLFNGATEDPGFTAIPANATDAALRVAQSLLLRASRMLLTAADKACSARAHPAW